VSICLGRASVARSTSRCSVLVGMSGHFLSVLDAAARLVFSARCSEHITPLLHDLHWLRVPERIRFRLCVLTQRCLDSTASPYLAEDIRRAADVDGRRHLSSSAATDLVVPPVGQSTLGVRDLPVAAPPAWNSLPSTVRATPSFLAFRRELRTFLFRPY